MPDKSKVALLNALINKQKGAISNFDEVPEEFKHKVQKNINKRERKIKRLEEEINAAEAGKTENC